MATFTGGTSSITIVDAGEQTVRISSFVQKHFPKIQDAKKVASVFGAELDSKVVQLLLKGKEKTLLAAAKKQLED